MPGYQWFKVDTAGWLEGSIRSDLDMEQRGIWIDILALASRCRLRDGTLRFAEGKPMSRERIAAILNVPLDKLDKTIEICSEDKNIYDDKHRLEIWEDGTIQITNWERYQAVPPDKKQLPVDDREQELTGRRNAIRGAYKFPDEVTRVIDKIKGVKDGSPKPKAKQD